MRRQSVVLATDRARSPQQSVFTRDTTSIVPYGTQPSEYSLKHAVPNRHTDQVYMNGKLHFTSFHSLFLRIYFLAISCMVLVLGGQ